MGDQHLRILLHERRHRLHRRLLLRHVHDDEVVGSHAHFHRMGSQQLRHVHAGAALDDLHVQAALAVLARGQGLVEAAMFGLGAPVGGEADHGEPAVGLPGRRAGGHRRHRREHDPTQYLQGDPPG